MSFVSDPTCAVARVSTLEDGVVGQSLEALGESGEAFRTVLADPPWRFMNRTGKMAPEHRRLARYETMTVDEIAALPIQKFVADKAHLYLWVPNALLADGMRVMSSWGFTYKTNLVWFKTRKDGGPDRRGVGFYFRNVTELVLFGIRGKDNRTLAAGRRQPNLIAEQKREHSRKPDQLYEVIEACSPSPRLELFARTKRAGWTQWGDEIGSYKPTFSSPAYTREAAAAG
jgi:N6-adenosine-specific RNA methylase IME4